MFRPKFCCNCGEQIERSEWRVWTSRRFCQPCSSDHRHVDLFPYFVGSVGIILSLVGMKGIFANLSSPEVPERTIMRSGTERRPSANEQKIPVSLAEPAANASGPVNKAVVQEITEQPALKRPPSDESVFYCGAITKKGTRCTRRVKSKGFCWQHSRSAPTAPTRF